MMTKGFLLAILALAVFPAFAEEEWVEKEGVVREIFQGDRTAIISGFRYYFGRADGYQTADVQLIGYSVASFEMLQVGMKVQFHYTPDRPWRRILRLRQLPDDSWLDNDELPDAIPKTGNLGT